MESRNKLTMCRLCLGENGCFINVFEMNDVHSYIAAEVITDLLQFQVSESDVYPHVVCSACISKLTDFKLFKECCQKSKDKYDDMFVSSDSLEDHQPVMATIKSEEVIIDSSHDEASEDPFKENETEVSCGPILLKYEVLPFSRDSRPQDELMESRTSDNSPSAIHPTSSNAEVITSDLIKSEIIIKEEPSECLLNKRPHCLSKGEVDPDSCTWSTSTNNQSIIEKSNNVLLPHNNEASSIETMERLDRQEILPGEGSYIVSFYQHDLNIKKEVDKEKRRVEEDIGGDGEAYRVTGPEKRVRKRREGLECFHCGIVLMDKLVLVKHMKVHGLFYSYKCAECDKVFRFNSKLKIHVLTHTGSKPYKCAKCSKRFTAKSSLITHMRIHTGYKPYKCTVCSKTFIVNSSLKVHMRSHTGSKPYKCTVCSKSFTMNYNLTTHMRTHTGLKPYKCGECSKCFTVNSNLVTHMRIHTGSKPYQCIVCSKSFTTNDALTKHMRTHTGLKPYKCAECNKCFSKNCSLKVHMRSHTNFLPHK